MVLENDWFCTLGGPLAVEITDGQVNCRPHGEEENVFKPLPLPKF